MVPTSQWLIRWGCLGLIGLATLMQIVGMASPFWVRDQARPAAYPAFLLLLRQAGVDPDLQQAGADPAFNLTQPGTPGAAEGVIRRVGADVGLWKWCVEVEIAAGAEGSTSYRACHTPNSSEFPGWWRGCQVTSVVGTLMGALACVCAGLELHYLRRGVRFSGLIVLCSISCFVAALGIGVSHGMFASSYTRTVAPLLHLPPSPGGPAVYALYPAALGWAFGLGAAAAVLMGSTGILLLAVITRTYPTYHRAQSVVV